MSKKVIIDGCDLTGKTTLINKLIAYYNDPDLSYLHFSYRDRTDYDFYNAMLDKENFISDRHFIDEIIYPLIFNRKANLNTTEFAKLLDKCNKENIKIIILITDPSELLKRMRDEEEPEIKNNLLKINESFIDLAKHYNLQVFDTSKDSFENIVAYIGGKNERNKSNMSKQISRKSRRFSK